MSIEAEQIQDLDSRLLEQFDVTSGEIGERVLLRAQAASRSYAHRLYPNSGPGLVRWLNLVANLSELMLPRGWVRHDVDNVPRLIHKSRRLALVVLRGDDATGLPFGQIGRWPRSKYPRGAAVIRAVARNTTPVFPLFADLEAADVVDLDGYKTWFLVVHVDRKHIRSEISLPITSDSDYVERWADRLLLPALPNDGNAEGNEVHEDFSGSHDFDEIDIAIERI